jgi:5-methyltetrahydropteroyltriglutamate--homocysteine methyltransferase
MKRSTRAILTTHTGSLARPARLRQMLIDRDAGKAIDQREFDEAVRQAVAEVVRQQVDIGISAINDGEQSKIGFANYVTERLSGFEGADEARPISLDERATAQSPGRTLPRSRRTSTT